MAETIVTFSHRQARDAAVTGGKGAALARLVEAGLPVPEGFVITAQAFAQSTAELLPEIEAIIASADETNLQALQQACALAAERIVGHRPAAEIVDAVTRALADVAGDGAAVAVRSSATAEDMPQASFAGQYDSFLNVRGAHDVIERMLHVWASLYSAHAVAYRRRQQIPDAGMRMAVIVQRQLPAESAGVLFTRDPVSGDDGRFVVNATFGLGEGVVAGHMATDHFGLHPETGEVLARNVATKEYMVDLAPEGGLHTIEVARARQNAPSLDDAQLSELGSLARSVRSLFGGGHQDIEFAVIDGSIHLLQARPVTGVTTEPEFPVMWEDPADAKYAWMLGQIGQRKVLPARWLEQDVMRAYVEGSRVCFEETGSPMARMHIACYQNGYRYVRSPEVDEAEVAKRLERLGGRGLAHVERRTSFWEEELQPQVERHLGRVERFRPKRASLSELVAHLEDTLDAFQHVLGDLHWRFAGTGIAARRKQWPDVYHELTGGPALDAGTFLQAIDNKTTRMIRWLRNLARAVQSDVELRAVFETGAYERLEEPSTRTRPAVRRFQARFRDFLRRHGRRTGRGFGSATDFSTPTWGMAPKQPLDIIAAYARQDLDEIDRLEARARRERERASRRVRKMLAGDRQRLAEFEHALFIAQDQVRSMEDHNHMMEQATGGALREAMQWVGERLVRDGLVNQPDDVMHIALQELRDVAAGGGPSDLRALARERAAEFEKRSRMTPPPKLGSGEPPPMPSFPGYDPPANVGRDGMLIRGVGASRGRATGRAVVAPPTAQPPDIKKGDILVAENAGPNWTPVFPLISGLVLDQGAVFQHAALVAREYRIPAVIMTKEATSEIADGQTITVDGDEGVVELTT